jgi:hypothetical protein
MESPKLSNADEITALEVMMKKNCNTMYSLLHKWRETRNEKVTEQEAVAQCLLQMMICNVRSILLLCDGIKITDEIQTTLVDPTSMISILRSMYERAFIFHNIFVEPETSNEKDLLFYLWQIRGLNNRQNWDCIPQRHRQKEQKEKGDIQSLRLHAETLLDKMNIDECTKKKIIRCLNRSSSSIKGYNFIKRGGQITDFKEISLTDSPMALFGKNATPLYTLLSLHSHPSYIATLQFGQMFNDKYDQKLLKTLLTSVLFCQAKFVCDFCQSVPGAQIIFEGLTKSEQQYFEEILSAMKTI